jgi:hypothetical protein
MAPFLFPEWTENFKKWLLLLVAGAPVYLVFLIWYGVSPEALRIGYQPEQPVPYSHAVHVGELGLDCRYCHNTVEKSPHAAIPPAATCMNCHAGIRPESTKLTPVREAYATQKPLKWVRVNDLPDYVYFNHSAHVQVGVGCESCHGRVDRMIKVYQAKPLTMGWCLDCHRAPLENLRPPDKVTVMGFKATDADRRKIAARKIKPPTNCSTCHR